MKVISFEGGDEIIWVCGVVWRIFEIGEYGFERLVLILGGLFRGEKPRSIIFVEGLSLKPKF
jgi:hypothetical protein